MLAMQQWPRANKTFTSLTLFEGEEMTRVLATEKNEGDTVRRRTEEAQIGFWRKVKI
jgi:hypothetical protein